ncbi:hypothetical protein MKK63_26075 [Methylobacterium sp. J-088]|nr:hypothetical protein [Methylobacterium sp. J-088]
MLAIHGLSTLSDDGVRTILMDSFTARERAAFTAGIETARQMALTAVVTIEVRDDAGRVQHQAAVAALQALAEGTRDLMLEATGIKNHCNPVVQNNGTEAGIGREAGP